jgi:hypothetical protein
MMRYFVLFLLFLTSGELLASDSCIWDGFRKNVWIDELNQQGIHMAYPLPHDLFSHRLTGLLDESDKYIIGNTVRAGGYTEGQSERRDVQIIIQPKLIDGDYVRDSFLFGSGPGGQVRVALQFSIYDNYSKTIIRKVDVRETKRVWLSIFQNSQSELHDQVIDIIDGKTPDIVALVMKELDCIPYAARMLGRDGNNIFINGGSRNNIKPKLSLSVLGLYNNYYGDGQLSVISYKKLADAVVETVSPSTSSASLSEAINLSYTSAIVTHQ